MVTLEGSEDWVRCLSFMISDEKEMFLASSSQDNMVRVWKIAPIDEKETATFFSASVSSLGPSALLQGQSAAISRRGHLFRTHSQTYSVMLDAVLSGHDDWVYSVAWHPKKKLIQEDGSFVFHQPMILLTASMDKTLIVWKPSPGGGIWMEDVRVGESGGQGLGFFGGLFSPDGGQIVAHGYQGGFHLWTKTNDPSDPSEDKWVSDVAISGHFGPVHDISWDPSNNYFVSVRSDLVHLFSFFLFCFNH